jgi:hypothetical protein
LEPSHRAGTRTQARGDDGQEQPGDGGGGKKENLGTAGDLARLAAAAHGVRERQQPPARGRVGARAAVLAGMVELVEEVMERVVNRRRSRSARECVGSGTSGGANRARAAAASMSVSAAARMAAAASMSVSAAARMAAARSAGIRMGLRSSSTAATGAPVGVLAGLGRIGGRMSRRRLRGGRSGMGSWFVLGMRARGSLAACRAFPILRVPSAG